MTNQIKQELLLLNPYGAYTVAQVRDLFLQTCPVSSKLLDGVKTVTVALEAEYKVNDKYVKCPRCYGFHQIKENYDGLCNTCKYHLMEHYDFPQLK